MTRWIVGAFVVVCLLMAGYFIFRPKDNCDYTGHARKAGVDFGATIEHVTAVKGNLGLSDEDIATLDQFRLDYAEKYRNLCLDWKRKTIKDDEYNCRRANMDKVLDQFRLLSTVSDAKDKGHADQALNAIKQFASAGESANCGPRAQLVANPDELELSAGSFSVFTQVTNLGTKDARYTFDQLPLSFLPTPASGSIGSGVTVSIVFVRTKYPMSDKEIRFVLRDDSSEQISLKIKVRQLNNDVYATRGSALSESSGATPTLEDALNFVKRTWDSKSEAADYLAAANILDSVGNTAAASRAASLAATADKSLDDNPTAQLTFAVLKAKSGDNRGAQAAFKVAAQTVSSTGSNPALVRYFSGVADLKMGDWSSAKENLCSPETRGWAQDHAAWLGFGVQELGIPGVDEAVDSESCGKRVLVIALSRTTPNDPEHHRIIHVMAEDRLTDKSGRHVPQSD